MAKKSDTTCGDCVKGFVTTEGGQELECATCNGTGVNAPVVAEDAEEVEEVVEQDEAEE